jgi:hypothetical protein
MSNHTSVRKPFLIGLAIFTGIVTTLLSAPIYAQSADSNDSSAQPCGNKEMYSRTPLTMHIPQQGISLTVPDGWEVSPFRFNLPEGQHDSELRRMAKRDEDAFILAITSYKGSLNEFCSRVREWQLHTRSHLAHSDVTEARFSSVPPIFHYHTLKEDMFLISILEYGILWK